MPLVAAFKLQIVPREAESQGPRDFQIWLHSDASSNSDLQFDLSGGDQDNACSYTFEPAATLLPARQSCTSRLRVEPLTVLAPNERKTHTFRVTATPRGGIVPPAGDEARLTQTGAKPIALLLRPEKQSADLEAEYTVSAVNPSLVETKLNFSAHDPEAECSYEFQPAQLFLPAQTEGKTRLRVRAPSDDDGESSKTLRFTVAATREGDLLPTISTEGQLVQRPLKAIGLELLPPQQSASEAARYVVNARNPRPTAAKVWLGASDETDALSIDIFPNALALPAGGQASATLTAQPKEPLLPGEQRRVHRFTVFAKLDGSDKRFAASGVLAQVSRRAIPPTPRPVASPPPAVAQPQAAVRPVEPVQVEVNPPLRDGQPNANFQIHIRNPNSNQARVWLSAADDKDSLGFAFNPITLMLAPRAQGWAALAVRPKQRLTAGEKRRTYSFVVTARMEGVDRPATANGALVQTSGSACAGFVKSLVIIAVILFILYLILVIGLVR